MPSDKAILLVEDEALIALKQADILQKNGFTVYVAHNGEKALSIVREEAIDLVLMDIDLGKGNIDGTEVAELMLKDRDLPIVFCTSHAEKEMVDKVKNITRFSYVIKNSGEFVLIESINMAFELFEVQKELKNSEKFLNSVIDQSPVSTWISDKNGVLIKLNDASRKLFGVSDDSEVVGKYDFHKDDILIERGVVSKVEEVFTKGKTFQFEIDYDYRRVKHVHVPGATHKILDCTISPLRNAKGEITNAIFQQIDITKQKETEEAKDYLLKEMNHRIKNNLAMINSLINLKSSDLDNAVDLTDLEHQIDAIRLVHEQLYQTESITHINFEDYIRDLLSTVFSSFTSRQVKIKEKLESVTLTTKTAVSLGLVVNEIATNAIKYGFTGDEAEAVFSVELKKCEDTNCYVLTLSNTGKPFPEDIDLDNPETLGLRLISILTDQIKGTLELTRTPHPKFTVQFPIEESDKKV